MLSTVVSLRQVLHVDRRAVTALEYGLIASLIAIVVVASVSLTGNHLSTVFNKVATTL
jgi:pilus assembly protein Flp/PilA